MNIGNVKTRVFKKNEQYFKFLRRDDIRVYSVGFTKSRDIRVEYKTLIAGKDIKKKRKNKRLGSAVLCV